LAEDLQRNGADRFTLERNASLEVPGLGQLEVPILLTSTTGTRQVLDLRHPLAPGVAIRTPVRDMAEVQTMIPVILVDELLIRRNLPRATANILGLVQ